MKNRLIFLFFSIIIILSVLIVRFTKYYSIACADYAKIGIKSSVTMDINQVLSSEINDNKCSEIVCIKYSNNNEITAIEIDSGKINSISNDISTKINETVIDCEHKYGVPLGNAFGSKIFSGYGPTIKVKVLPIGSVSYEIKSELVSGGINQTIHRITVKYYTEIQCLAPFNENIISIDTQIVLSETLIVGKVPDISLSPLR